MTGKVAKLCIFYWNYQVNSCWSCYMNFKCLVSIAKNSRLKKKRECVWWILQHNCFSWKWKYNILFDKLFTCVILMNLLRNCLCLLTFICLLKLHKKCICLLKLPMKRIGLLILLRNVSVCWNSLGNLSCDNWVKSMYVCCFVTKVNILGKCMFGEFTRKIYPSSSFHLSLYALQCQEWKSSLETVFVFAFLYSFSSGFFYFLNPSSYVVDI